jgi:8-amino-7-oxononanoate synthase
MNTVFVGKELQQLQETGTYRRLRTVDSAQGRAITIDGRQVVNFSSNDYLGLANDARLQKAAIEAIEHYGVGAGASRLICGNMTPHEKLEAELACFKHTEAALVYSSGYMANAGIIPALADRHSMVFSDKLNHASVVDGITLSRAECARYPHADVQALEGLLKNCTAKRKFIVTDTVFSMDGDKAPLKEIVTLAHRYEAILMVDEAHGFGVLGPKGSGLVEELGLEGQVDVQMGTLSKAAGSFGAYVAVAKILKEYFINKSRSFIYTTAIPPSLAQAARAAIKIIREGEDLRRRLQAHGDYLRSQLRAMGFDTLNSTTPIIPILAKDPVQAVAMSQQLLEHAIYLQAIRPPTVPQGTSRLRLTVTAGHTQEDLDHLLNALRKL